MLKFLPRGPAGTCYRPLYSVTAGLPKESSSQFGDGFRTGGVVAVFGGLRRAAEGNPLALGEVRPPPLPVLVPAGVLPQASRLRVRLSVVVHGRNFRVRRRSGYLCVVEHRTGSTRTPVETLEITGKAERTGFEPVEGV